MIRKILSIVLSAVLLVGVSGCSSMNNTGKGALIGAGGGAALGAGVGAIFGGGTGAAIGAAVGTAVGAGAGALIGRKMDKQKQELENIEGAQVETVTDQNNLQAIKVTLDSGILFATGKSPLSSAAKQSLSEFANSLKNNPDTDVAIQGYTDNTGSREVNDRLSNERASVVKNYLANSGVPTARMDAKGYAWDNPVASNDTEAGRAQNRRVEIYITANQAMINQAEAGTLK